MAIVKHIVAFAASNKVLVGAYVLFAAAAVAVSVFGVTKLNALLYERVSTRSNTALLILASLAALTVAYLVCNFTAGYAESILNPLFYSTTVNTAMQEVVDINQSGHDGLLDVRPLDYQSYIDVTAESSMVIFCSMLRTYIPNMLLVLATMAYFTHLDYRYGLIFVVGAAVLIGCCFWFKNAIYKGTVEAETCRNDADNYAFDVLSCLNTVVSKNKGHDECRIAGLKSRQAAEARIKLNHQLNFINYGLTMFVSVLGMFAVVGLQKPWNELSSSPSDSVRKPASASSTPATVIVTLTLVAMLQTRLNTLGSTNVTVVKEVGRNVAHAASMPSMVVSDVVLDPNKLAEIIEGLSKSVTIEFVNVTFTHSGAKHPVVVYFSWQLVPGINVLRAPSGSGKTTLARLLLRLAQPQSGKILLNGLDLQGIPQEVLRKHICFTNQDMGVLDRTLYEILAYGTQVTQEEVEAVWSQISSAFPNMTLSDTSGLQGRRLSTGQKQLLRMGNVLLSKASIVVVDEPCTGLDANMRSLVMQLLQSIGAPFADPNKHQRTVWIITHEDDVVALADNLKESISLLSPV